MQLVSHGLNFLVAFCVRTLCSFDIQIFFLYKLASEYKYGRVLMALNARGCVDWRYIVWFLVV